MKSKEILNLISEINDMKVVKSELKLENNQKSSKI